MRANSFILISHIPILPRAEVSQVVSDFATQYCLAFKEPTTLDSLDSKVTHFFVGNENILDEVWWTK